MATAVLAVELRKLSLKLAFSGSIFEVMDLFLVQERLHSQLIEILALLDFGRGIVSLGKTVRRKQRLEAIDISLRIF